LRQACQRGYNILIKTESKKVRLLIHFNRHLNEKHISELEIFLAALEHSLLRERLLRLLLGNPHYFQVGFYI
jgi:hypothetical protein